jgi:hypothetical protein
VCDARRQRRDFERLYAMSRAGKSVVVVGGGLLGSEITVALAHMSASRPPVTVCVTSYSRGEGAEQSLGSKGGVHQLFPEAGVLGLYLPNYLSAYTTLSLQKSACCPRREHHRRV